MCESIFTTLSCNTEIILAMRHKWLELILSGIKVAEIRRTRPAEGKLPCRLWLYQGGMIHGCVDTIGFAEYFTPSELSKHRDTQKMACLSEMELEAYLWKAKNPIVYYLDTPRRAPRPFPVTCRPQSWQYMTDELRAICYAQMDKKGDNR